MRRATLVKLSIVIIINLIASLSVSNRLEGQTLAPTASVTIKSPVASATATATLSTTATTTGTSVATSTSMTSTASSMPPTNVSPTVPPATTPAAPTLVGPVAVTPVLSASCTLAEVSVFVKTPHLEVKCTKPTNGISYFAMSTTDAAVAQPVLMLLTTAVTDKKTVRIAYDDTDTSGQAFGCLSKDCRLITEVTLIP